VRLARGVERDSRMRALEGGATRESRWGVERWWGVCLGEMLVEAVRVGNLQPAPAPPCPHTRRPRTRVTPPGPPQ
jgi:hypothetical protein